MRIDSCKEKLINFFDIERQSSHSTDRKIYLCVLATIFTTCLGFAYMTCMLRTVTIDGDPADEILPTTTIALKLAGGVCGAKIGYIFTQITTGRD